MSEDESALVNKCLEICQALVRQGHLFSFSLKVKPFSFSLDTKVKENALESRTVTEKVTKKPSPSTLRRNQRRKQEFLKKKLEEEEKSVVTHDLEATRQPNDTFKCVQCENTFETEKGLKIHIGRTHKTPKPLPTPEKVRGSPLETSLSVSPDKQTERVEEGGERDEEEDEIKAEENENVYGSSRCLCCGEVRSLEVKALMSHQCSEGTKIICKECGKDFKTSWYLSSHTVQEQHWDG